MPPAVEDPSPKIFAESANLKQTAHAHWTAEPCGTRELHIPTEVRAQTCPNRGVPPEVHAPRSSPRG